MANVVPSVVIMQSAAAVPLSQLEVLVVDCQATTAAPRGRLLEIGWACAGTSMSPPESRLVTMPGAERVPPAVVRITGITDRMLEGGIEARDAWRALCARAAALAPQPTPTVIHFARFERPFLCQLAGGTLPLDVVCTHELAKRLLPDLPRRSLRALAGYFGRAVGLLRRSAEHVDATAFVWRELVQLLEQQGVSTWSEMKRWLAVPAPSAKRRRVWPMPRDIRLALPDAPGVYRMLRTSGDVLYVGKAASLHDRVNSYFRHQRGVPERLLEMLSQARAIGFEVTATALEAALLESDEIKRARPPYNIALTDADRRLWFASRDLTERAPGPSARCPLGPFASGETVEQFAILVEGGRASLGRGRWAPDERSFREGHNRFLSAHAGAFPSRARTACGLLRLGNRLWGEGRRELDTVDDVPATEELRRRRAWTPEYVQLSLEWLVIRAALARRRARWLTRLAEASIVWREPGASQSRLIVIENGEVSVATGIDPEAEPPVPPGHSRPALARRAAFTVARFDRLRVLTTEMKRLTTSGAPVSLRLGGRPPLAGARLAALLAWL